MIGHTLVMQKNFKEIKCRSLKMNNYYCFWEHSPQWVLKLNVDSVVFFNQHIASVGIILQDLKGVVFMKAIDKKPEVNDPTIIELLAIFRGLHLSVHLEINNIIIKNDSLLMV